MDKTNILKAVVNAVVSWVAVALIIGIKTKIGFGAAFLKPQVITVAVVAGLASYIGLFLREKR